MKGEGGKKTGGRVRRQRGIGEEGEGREGEEGGQEGEGRREARRRGRVRERKSRPHGHFQKSATMSTHGAKPFNTYINLFS